VCGNVRFARHYVTAVGQEGVCPLAAALRLPARSYSDLLPEGGPYGTTDASRPLTRVRPPGSVSWAAPGAEPSGRGDAGRGRGGGQRGVRRAARASGGARGRRTAPGGARRRPGRAAGARASGGAAPALRQRADAPQEQEDEGAGRVAPASRSAGNRRGGGGPRGAPKPGAPGGATARATPTARAIASGNRRARMGPPAPQQRGRRGRCWPPPPNPTASTNFGYTQITSRFRYGAQPP